MVKKTLDDYVKKENELELTKPQTTVQAVKELDEIANITDYEDEKRNMGFIRRSQLTKAKSRHLLDVAKLEYAKRLDVVKNLMTSQSKVANARIDSALNIELKRIDKELLEHLAEIGIGNFETRSKLQIRLAESTQKLFDDIQNSNLADFLKDDLVGKLIDERKALADEISETNKV
ncbi:MAG: hypothetical protein K8S23_00530 [Candidatus Cloacimonetes bacterium]|nr:hypothetical protein [Candidatus Cloacimonadota bacterium]